MMKTIHIKGYKVEVEDGKVIKHPATIKEQLEALSKSIDNGDDVIREELTIILEPLR